MACFATTDRPSSRWDASNGATRPGSTKAPAKLTFSIVAPGEDDAWLAGHVATEQDPRERITVTHLERLEPITLRGDDIELVPMSLEHVDALWEAGRHPELWEITISLVRSLDEMRDYVEDALAAARRGVALPFVTRWSSSGVVVGSTRFGNFERAHSRVEIGWTWVTPTLQRSIVNTQAKWLMLRHAFEVWELNRVELKTDSINERSQRAMERLGFVREGVLRRHAVTGTGRVRDTVYYSSIREDWPRQREHILALMSRARTQSSL